MADFYAFVVIAETEAGKADSFGTKRWLSGANRLSRETVRPSPVCLLGVDGLGQRANH